VAGLLDRSRDVADGLCANLLQAAEAKEEEVGLLDQQCVVVVDPVGHRRWLAVLM